MRKIFLLIALLISSLISRAQAVYSDPTVAAAISSTGMMHRNDLNKTNNQLSLIQKGQLVVMGELTIANDIQRNIYEGLSQVSSALRDALGIKRSRRRGSIYSISLYYI